MSTLWLWRATGWLKLEQEARKILFLFIYLFIFRNEMLPTKKDDKIDFLVSAYS